MLTLVRSTWPNQYYYKTLGKCYIGGLLMHSIALTGHNCMWKIWWLASLLTYWDSSLLLWKICHNQITWPRVVPESPLLPKIFDLFTSTSYSEQLPNFPTTFVVGKFFPLFHFWKHRNFEQSCAPKKISLVKTQISCQKTDLNS